MDSFDEVFAAVKEYCKEHVVIATYNLFINDIEPVSFDGNKAVLSVRSEFVKNTLENRYLSLLQEAFRELLGFEVEIEFTLPQKAPSPAPGAAQAAAAAGGNYAFTFENFIVGSTNKFAHAAAQAVAANPSGAYNPLFIWGGSGLGKTHLLHAIKSEVEKNHPDFNIVYVDGEKFTNEIISAIHDNTTTQFHNKYRAADVLLVDDIQFIGGKESTQEEFFHTFNTLYNSGKQIVLASDRAPREIKSLEDRLRTRFEMGLIADIQPPDFETRVAIIRRKADLLGLDMPDDVAEYIANRLKNNIRQLEGAVKKLDAYRKLEGIQPVIGAGQEGGDRVALAFRRLKRENGVNGKAVFPARLGVDGAGFHRTQGHAHGEVIFLFIYRIIPVLRIAVFLDGFELLGHNASPLPVAFHYSRPPRLRQPFPCG